MTAGVAVNTGIFCDDETHDASFCNYFITVHCRAFFMLAGIHIVYVTLQCAVIIQYSLGNCLYNYDSHLVGLIDVRCRIISNRSSCFQQKLPKSSKRALLCCYLVIASCFLMFLNVKLCYRLA